MPMGRRRRPAGLDLRRPLNRIARWPTGSCDRSGHARGQPESADSGRRPAVRRQVLAACREPPSKQVAPFAVKAGPHRFIDILRYPARYMRLSRSTHLHCLTPDECPGCVFLRGARVVSAPSRGASRRPRALGPKRAGSPGGPEPACSVPALSCCRCVMVNGSLTGLR